MSREPFFCRTASVRENFPLSGRIHSRKEEDCSSAAPVDNVADMIVGIGGKITVSCR